MKRCLLQDVSGDRQTQDMLCEVQYQITCQFSCFEGNNCEYIGETRKHRHTVDLKRTGRVRRNKKLLSIRGTSLRGFFYYSFQQSIERSKNRERRMQISEAFCG